MIKRDILKRGIKMMSSYLVIVLLMAAAISLKVGDALEMPKCKGQPIVMNPTQIQNIMGCAKMMGAQDPMKVSKEKIGCFSKCIMEKKSLIDAEGKPHKENINKLIDSTMPEVARTEAKTKMGACLDENGGKLDAKDPSCMSYLPLAQCSKKVMMEVCK